MTRLGLIAAFFSALFVATVALAESSERVGGVPALQQEEEETPEIGPYPGEEEPDCE